MDKPFVTPQHLTEGGTGLEQVRTWRQAGDMKPV